MISEVALALATHGQVDGDDQSLVLGLPGSLDQAPEKVLVAQHVRLKPKSTRRLFCDGLDRGGGAARQGVRNAQLRGRAGKCKVCRAPAEAGRSGGRDCRGHCRGPAQ